MKNVIEIGKRLVITGTLVWGLSSCLSETIPTPIIEIPDDPVSFSQEIIPIFEANCDDAGCHSTGAWAPDLTAANAYNALTSGGFVDAADPENSELYLKIAPGGSMEQFITPEETGKILGWIQQGAQNN